jgi:apolipoprotein N-acyltransferase
MSTSDTALLEDNAHEASSTRWLACLSLFLLGAVATLGWSPVGQTWIAWSAFVVLVMCITRAAKSLQVLLLSFCFALGMHTTGHGWVFSALQQHTEAGLFWSCVGSAFFLTYLSAFLAVPAAGWKWLSNRLKERGAHANQPKHGFSYWSVVLAVAWTTGESLRGKLFNGFDSLAAGYVFSDWPLRGWVPVLGVYGCSLLFYTSAAVAGAAWACRSGSIRWPATGGCLTLALLLAGGAMLDAARWVEPVGSALTFRLIQGGVAQQAKFDPGERERQVAAYADAITAAPADLIVTPETAFTTDLTELNPAVLARIRAFSEASGANIFLGIPHLDGSVGVKNSVVHLAPGTPEMGRYDKTRLMPFGEYTPSGFGWFTDRMNVALNDQSAGLVNQKPFQIRANNTNVRIGVLICHEDLSYQDAQRWTSQIGLFINPGNLAWFEGSLALPQRLQIARARALETGRPMLRTTNTGVTAHIDEKGRVVSQLPMNKAGALTGTIQPTEGFTPFTTFGNWVVIGLACSLVLMRAALDLLVRSQRTA